MRVLNYCTAKQTDSVVVIGAGPSSASNKSKISEYCLKNNSFVIAANYNYGFVKSDLTCISDFEKLKEIKNLYGDLVVPSVMYSLAKKLHKTRNRKIFSICSKKYKNNVYVCEKLKIDDCGNFLYGRMGTAGFTSIAVSILFRPKKVLIVGIDGPKPGLATKILYKPLKDKCVEVKYGKHGKHDRITNYLSSCLFPYMIKSGIYIETFSDVVLHDIDKKSLGINII